MRNLGLVVVLAIGCWNNKAPVESPAPEPAPAATVVRNESVAPSVGGTSGFDAAIDEALDGLEEFRTKMCACKDKPCADRINDQYKVWESDVLEPKLKGIDPSKIDRERMDRGDQLDRERKDCRAKLRDQDLAP